jgi:hypothetical protein
MATKDSRVVGGVVLSALTVYCTVHVLRRTFGIAFGHLSMNFWDVMTFIAATVCWWGVWSMTDGFKAKRWPF